METKEIELVFDMDGVIADLLTTMVDVLSKNYGEQLKNEDITEWDFHKACRTGVTPQQVYSHFGDEGFWLKHKPIPGAVEAITKLIGEGFNVSILTACEHGYIEKRQWLKTHLPAFNLRKLNFSTEKHRFRSHVFVDDHIGNLKPYQEANPNSLVVCFDAPYNQKWDGERALNWDWLYGRIWDFKGYLETKQKFGR